MKCNNIYKGLENIPNSIRGRKSIAHSTKHTHTLVDLPVSRMQEYTLLEMTVFFLLGCKLCSKQAGTVE